jgi:2-C-methyl-D-erythritol 4-phosphate cytidylyltransferase
MGLNVDKLFLEVAGQPLIAHTWKRFDDAASIDEVILVIREGMEGEFQRLAAAHSFHKPYRLVAGGPQRQDSVWHGLQAITHASELVAIHDGARPCVTGELIAATLSAARVWGAAVAAQRVTDTIKESTDGYFIVRNVDRTRLWSVQTPQAFQVPIIQRALQNVRSRGLLVTDDTAACELLGQPVRLVESKIPNPKVTTPSDLVYVEILLRSV